jgi:hypothetical protein
MQNALESVSKLRILGLVATYKNRMSMFEGVKFVRSAILFYSSYGRQSRNLDSSVKCEIYLNTLLKKWEVCIHLHITASG